MPSSQPEQVEQKKLQKKTKKKKSESTKKSNGAKAVPMVVSPVTPKWVISPKVTEKSGQNTPKEDDVPLSQLASEKRSRLAKKLDTLNSNVKKEANRKKEKQRKASEEVRRRQQISTPPQQTSEKRPQQSGYEFKCLFPECGEKFRKQEFLDLHVNYNDHQVEEPKNPEIEAGLNELQNLFPLLPPDYIKLVFNSAEQNIVATANRLIGLCNNMARTADQQQATSSKPTTPVVTPKTKRRVQTKRTKGQASPEKDSSTEMPQPNLEMTSTKTGGKGKKNQSPKALSPPQKKSKRGKEVVIRNETAQRWSKFESFDAQEDQEARRQIMADIQFNELEAN